jgi:hypothetical protein
VSKETGKEVVAKQMSTYTKEEKDQKLKEITILVLLQNTKRVIKIYEYFIME